MQITGYYKDEFNSPVGKQTSPEQWVPNKIVNDCNVLLAALMKNHPNFDGVLLEWDNNRPDASEQTTQLVDEIARFQVNQDQVRFVGGDGIVPTNAIEITVDIPGSALISQGFQYLREFGLFGGDATSADNSGYMIDYVIHPRIDLTPSDTINRQVRLIFDSSSAEATQRSLLYTPPTTHWLSTNPVTNLDGVGDAYAAALAAVGTTTIGELADMDIDTAVTDLPPMKFVELRTKAQLALRTVVNISPTSDLTNKTAWEVITTTSSVLATEASILEDSADQLRDQISGLQLSLDNRFLQHTTIGELQTP